MFLNVTAMPPIENLNSDVSNLPANNPVLPANRVKMQNSVLFCEFNPDVEEIDAYFDRFNVLWRAMVLKTLTRSSS